jgi:hypothetical protein
MRIVDILYMRIVDILYICIVAIHNICSIKFKEKSTSIYTYLYVFFCLNDKLSSVSEKNNTPFFLRSKDNYVAQTFIFNEVQKVFLKVLFFIIAVFLEKRLLLSSGVLYGLLGVLSN